MDAITTPLLKTGAADSGAIDVITTVTRSSTTDITLTSAGTITVPTVGIQTGGGTLLIIAGATADPPPNIPSGSIISGHFRLSFATAPGQSYIIRTSTTLAPGSFTIADTITATGITTLWTDPALATGSKFYTIESP